MHDTLFAGMRNLKGGFLAKGIGQCDACGPPLTPVFSGSGPKKGPRIVMYDRLVSLLSPALAFVSICPTLESPSLSWARFSVNIYRVPSSLPPLATENGNLYQAGKFIKRDVFFLF